MTVQAYKTVKRVSAVEGTSPHQLIALLYDAALSQIAMAVQHQKCDNKQELHKCVDKAVAIVQELQACLLDYETNELAGNLFELYAYIVKTLMETEKEGKLQGFATCTELLNILSSTWKSIAPETEAA